MRKILLILILLVTINLTLAYTYEDCSIYGNCAYSDININETYYYNASGNTTQFTTDGDTLTLLESYLSDFFDSIFRNFFDQSLNTTDDVTFNNVTANYFNGNWNGSYLYAPNTTAGIQALRFYNKSEINNLIPFNEVFFYYNTSSDIGNDYNMRVAVPNSTSHTFSFAGVTDGQNLINFTTIAGKPGFEFIGEGNHRFISYIRKTNTGSKSVRIFYKLYILDSLGTETLIFTTGNTDELLMTTEFLSVLFYYDRINLNLTDRLKVEVYSGVTGVGVQPDIELYVDDETKSRYETPMSIPSLSGIYVNQTYFSNTINSINTTANIQNLINGTNLNLSNLQVENLNVTGTSYLGNLILSAENFSVGNIINLSQTINFTSTILPYADNLFSLGSLTNRFLNGFFSGTLFAKNGNFTELNTSSLNVENKTELLSSYDTGWINNNDWTNTYLGTTVGTNVTHNLNAHLNELLVRVFISTDGTDANSFEPKLFGYDGSSPAAITGGYTAFETDTNKIRIKTANNGVFYVLESGGALFIDNENWYYRVKVIKVG